MSVSLVAFAALGLAAAAAQAADPPTIASPRTGERLGAVAAWQSVPPAGGIAPTERHESGLAAVGRRLYLMGGRGNRPIEVHDLATGAWTTAAVDSLGLHHFQPAVIGDLVYVIGAFTGVYPSETSVATIHAFDTSDSNWSVVGQIPAARVRGSAATAVRDGWIYLVGGNTQGHNGGAVAWFDRWRPSDGAWEVLPDAPNARDHVGAAFVDGKLVVAGGRQTEQPNPFENAVAATDVYDPVSGSWSAGAPIPTLRAGALTAGHAGRLVVAGGEIDTNAAALDVVEAYDARADRWRALPPLLQGRHSGGGALLDGELHVVAGSAGRGGSPEIDSHERLALPSGSDTDDDGLVDRLSASWAPAPGSGHEYWVYLGSAPGRRDLLDSGSLGSATELVVDELPSDGRALHLRLWHRAPGEAWAFVDRSFQADGTNEQPAITFPTPGATLTEPVTFAWSEGSGFDEYWLHVGTVPGGANVHDSGALGAATSAGVPAGSLPSDGGALYVTFWYRVGGYAWQSVRYDYTAPGTPVFPVIEVPAEGAPLEPDEKVAPVAWSAVGGPIAQYWLYVGSAPGRSDYHDSGSLGDAISHAIPVGTLPASGTVQLRLWYRSVEGGAWRFVDFEREIAGGSG